MVKILSLILALTVVVGPTSAQARKVYLNGVDISAVRGQTFKQATVAIDSNGDIRIDAPGYKVEVVDQNQGDKKPPQSTPVTVANDRGGPNPLLTKRYYLVSQPSPEGRAQYDFKLTVNGVMRKKIAAGTPQVIMEISSWLQVGENEIVVVASKNLEGGQKSTAASDQSRIVIGTGGEEAKIVKIDRILASMQVDASTTSNQHKRFVITAQ